MIVYFSGVSEQTKIFVDRLGMDSIRIPLRSTEAGGLVIPTPYILITPSYAGGNQSFGVPRQVAKFLVSEINRENLLGVIAGGNRNFGEKFGIAGDQISVKCGVPVLMRFEVFGTDEDVEEAKHGIRENWDKLVALKTAKDL